MRGAYYADEIVTLYHGDALDVATEMPDATVDCIVTSPPYYGLRDYGTEGQYGLEPAPADYVERMRGLFAELRRVLADDGTLWLNLGDSYASAPPGRTEHADRSTTLSAGRHGTATAAMRESVRQAGVDRSKVMPPKNLLGMPWRVAFALQDDGWILRNAIVWHKPNAMPESIKDRLSGRYEHIFLFAKSPRYWFDLDAVRVEYSGDRTPSRTARTGATNKPNSIATPWRADNTPYPDGMKPQPLKAATGERHRLKEEHPNGRNPGDVWVIPTQPFTAAHFAVMPPVLAQHCILAGCKPGGTVLDPFNGSGTTGAAAQRTGRRYIGIDLNAEYLELTLTHPHRLRDAALDFDTTSEAAL